MDLVCRQSTPDSRNLTVMLDALPLGRSLVRQDTHAIDDESKLRLDKLLNATQESFSERALLENKNQVLVKQSNEVKYRRSTKSMVLGRAKVMSYEDLEEAQAKRGAKEAKKTKESAGGSGKALQFGERWLGRLRRREGAS